ncbi:hypothetical protein GOC74_04265 [Halomicrobium mukohataei]|uniref:Uncharacterized protein n=1 Tax=Halomicrobium mukohataei TaxID=57705 RepID=A0A847TSX5_9EURY|nr:hypothetical protein [Halomicrobium mukohataei]NLV09142.1 hypothetical protein [Halomicrobium mukohataei]
MADIVNLKTGLIAAIISVVGLVANPTRNQLSGSKLYLWIVATIAFSIVLAGGIQYFWTQTRR